MAYEMVTSGKVQQAFDVAREPGAMRERYGRVSIGEKALLARRLVEAGVTFVLVSGAWGYFDHHGDEVRWRLFRFAYLLIAVAILAPPLIIAGFQLEPGMLTQTGSSPNYVSRLVFSIALSCVGPLCLAAAVVCAFGSVLPRDTFSGPPRIVPQKHPLD